MLAAIRLADRRGKLTGDLSQVQEFALTMLLWKETQDTDEAHDNARIDAVKMALVASSKVSMEKMFPEYVPDSDDPSEYTSDIPVDEAKRIEDLLSGGGILRFDDL